MNYSVYVPIVNIYEDGTVDIDFSSSYQTSYEDGEEREVPMKDTEMRGLVMLAVMDAVGSIKVEVSK